MISLILGVCFFVGIHLFISGTGLRGELVQRYGERLYMAMFSLLSLLGLVWMIAAYHTAPYVELWGQLTGGRWLSSLLVLIAFLFIVPGMLSRNPTAIGGEALLGEEEPARGIFRISRHPFLMGFAIWSATHMIYNGDLSSNIFFGGFFILSVFGPCAIDKKLASQPDWQAFADKTSIFPFIAILDQRNTLEIKELLNWRLAAAIIVYIAVFKLHRFMFGVAPIITGS